VRRLDATFRLVFFGDAALAVARIPVVLRDGRATAFLRFGLERVIGPATPLADVVRDGAEPDTGRAFRGAAGPGC